MSNQSLDSGEILNVRWATEDPNPGQIKAEKRRVEAVGKKAIEGKINGDFAEAALTVQALEEGREEGLYALEPVDASVVAEEQGGGGKRRRIEAPDAEQDEEDAAYAALEQREQEEEPVVEDKSGLLDRDALEGMKYFLQIKRQREEEERRVKAAGGAAKSAPKGMGLLGGYGSGSEDEED